MDKKAPAGWGDGWARAKARRRTMQEAVNSIMNGGSGLTDWEERFVDEMDAKLKDEGFAPTEAQLDKVNQIYDRRC